MRRKRPASEALDDDSQKLVWLLDHERARAKSAEDMALEMQHTARQLEDTARQLQCNKEMLQSMSRFIAAKQCNDIRMLKAVARQKICQLTQLDFSSAMQNWDTSVQSLSSADCRTLHQAGFTSGAIQATKLDNTEKRFMCAACKQADSEMIAIAVADLPQPTKERYTALFDAVFGKHAFSTINDELQGETV